ncbi:MAG: tetratricopeptide repeat protein [Polyangiaceae bacterium]
MHKVGTRALRALAVGAVLTALGGVPSRALAEEPQTPTPTERAQAETFFQLAKGLEAQGKMAEACPKYEESLRLDPKPGTALNLATCHDALGLTASAWVEFLEAARLSAKAKQPERERFAEKRAEELEAKLSKVTFKLEGSAPEGLELRLDGRPMAVQSLGTPLPLDPGPHSLFARAPGHARGETPFVVAAGPSAATVVISALAAESPARAEAPQVSTPAPTAPASGGKRLPWPAVVSGVVGLAGVGVGTIFGIQAIRSKSEVDASCRGTVCSAAGLAANDDARSAAALSTVGFAVGVAGIVGAFVLLVVRQPDDPAPPRPTSSLGFGGPGGPGLSYSGAF